VIPAYFGLTEAQFSRPIWQCDHKRRDRPCAQRTFLHCSRAAATCLLFNTGKHRAKASPSRRGWQRANRRLAGVDLGGSALKSLFDGVRRFRPNAADVDHGHALCHRIMRQAGRNGDVRPDTKRVHLRRIKRRAQADQETSLHDGDVLHPTVRMRGGCALRRATLSESCTGHPLWSDRPIAPRS
jgi:hypothetical protein